MTVAQRQQEEHARKEKKDVKSSIECNALDMQTTDKGN